MEKKPLLTPSKTRALRKYLTGLANIELYFPMDETTGTTATNRAAGSLGARNGTISGATIGQSGIRGNGYSFDGVNDVITTTYNPFTAPVTFGGLAYRNTNVSGDCLIGGDNANMAIVRINSGGNNVSFWANSSSSTTTFNNAARVGEWFAWALTYDGSSAKLYINGQLVASNSYSVAFQSGNVYRIGAWSAALSDPFIGLMQHMFIASRILSPEEIQKIAKLANLG